MLAASCRDTFLVALNHDMKQSFVPQQVSEQYGLQSLHVLHVLYTESREDFFAIDLWQI